MGWGNTRTDSHDDQEAGAEAAEVQDGAPGALDEVIRVGPAAADPVGQRREDVGADDEQGIVHLEERAREDDEQEADGQHERQRDDGLEPRVRHRGRGRGGSKPFLLSILFVCLRSETGDGFEMQMQG